MNALDENRGRLVFYIRAKSYLSFSYRLIMRKLYILAVMFCFIANFCISTAFTASEPNAWLRINLLGYPNHAIKVAIWASKQHEVPQFFELIDKSSNQTVFRSEAVQSFGAYGPFVSTARLDFSAFKTPGRYFLRANGVISPEIIIGNDVYKGAADFALRYMRQQRCGFNPSLKDSCHTHDGFMVYGKNSGIKDSTHFDATGGWHDASDYLQYSTTSANAAYHLLMAYRDFPKVFADSHVANGLAGNNGIPDVLDEARWGLDWLLKMHPAKNIMFNQLADDRDHISMRIPKLDSQYNKGYERPLYFIDGMPQQRGKFMNNTKGTSSTAAKFSSAFQLGSEVFFADKPYSHLLATKAQSAYRYAIRRKGVTQTVSVKSPYIYAEENWVDDMELALSKLAPRSKKNLDSALFYAKQEPVTPWITNDTANHYQWYPFVNIGHYELAKQLSGKPKAELIAYYKQGISSVWDRAKQNAFYRGIPFIWCSNNLTVSFTTQCFWYNQLSGDHTFAALEQANFDWLFGCNPWGTSMVYGLPSWGDTPSDPHSAFTHLANIPIDGGLVDGPVYTSIYKNLIGIKLTKADDYAAFQSDLAVYHDDYGDYSTNEPTMDGTASLVYLLAAYQNKSVNQNSTLEISHGAIIRGDRQNKEVALIFSADEFNEGANQVLAALRNAGVKASFFLTGNFYRNQANAKFINAARKDGHYLGAHSDKHLLYADWKKRDSLLLTKQEFDIDIKQNYKEMAIFGIAKRSAKYFLPPYEWYNQQISNWTEQQGLTLVNFTPGTYSNADYTYPELGKSYRSSESIYQSILSFERNNTLNGAMLLMHFGTDPRRKDKFYKLLPQLITYLKSKGYQLRTIDKLLDTKNNSY
jgi:peptidoglycan/xylan/chitin deacetylase (PgdA/CDA1 family)